MEPLKPSVLAALPLFPLPDVVLFPGALLPLHIVGERDRTMTADVLAGARVLGMARLRAGYPEDEAARPPVHDTAGVGYIVSSQKLEDGCYRLVLRGVARVAIDGELPPARPYREARAHLLLDGRSARPEALGPAHQQLIATCDRLAAVLPEGGNELRALARAVPSPGGCADVLAAALVTDPDVRQGLLETLDAADRLDRVIEHTSALVVRFADRSGRLPN
jgi:hypothetical protein